MTRPVLLSGLAGAIALCVVAAVAHAQVAGIRWTGAPATTLTGAEVAAAEAAAPRSPAVGREALPRRTLPNAAARVRNAASPPLPASAPNPHKPPPGARDGPTAQFVGGVAQSFPGIGFPASGGFVPPDPHGDVGPTQILAAVNARLRTIDKTTGVPDGALDVGANTFFAPVRGGSNISDQRVIYDRLALRWLIVTITTAFPNRILIAVSNNAFITPSTVWSLYQFQQDLVMPVGNDAGLLCDFPNAGVDANAVYIGCDMFDPASYYGSSLFVVNKASILSGGPIVVTVFRDLMGAVANPTGPGPNTPKGVTHFDPAATDGYFIGEDNRASGTLDLVRILDPGGTPTMLPFVPITTAAFQLPLPVEHLGNDHPRGPGTGSLDGGDNRVMNATMRGGTIWLAHTTAVDATGDGGAASPDRNAVRWYQIGSPATTPVVLQSGTLFDATPAQRSYLYGSLDVSGQGHAMFGFTLAGPNDYAGVAVDGRLLSDSSGTTQGVHLATAGLAAYVNTFDQGQFLPGAVRRWGDFSNTQVDPDDDMTFWTIQEYTEADGTWATRVARLLAPPPATPSAVTPSTIPADEPSVLVNVTGTSIAGSGFFDPGSGFAKRLDASIPGATINGVAFNGPTSITLDVSTMGSAAGTRNVTIVNPDGQSATGIGLLTIGAPGGRAATTTSLASALNPAAVGQDVPLTATVAPVPPASGTPTGSVTFYDGVSAFGSVPLVGGSATIAPATLAAGPHALSATYSGDASYYESASPVLAQQILTYAPVLTVTNNLDAGIGSLRHAIATAEPGATIVFNLACPTTIILTSGSLIVDKSLAIVGPGARCLTVSGNNASRVFTIPVPGIDVGIAALTITQGRQTGGGGVQNLGADLTLTNVAITGNNGLSGAGGGVDHAGGTLVVSGSTIAGNQNTFRGGGVQVGSGKAAFIDTTITSNTSVRGGGIRVGGSASVTLVHATVSHNAASGTGSTGGNLSALSGTITLRNTIVAQGVGTNPDLDPAGGTYLSLDYNQVDSGAFAPAAHDIAGPALPLGALANNGGSTDTRLPPAGSAVVDAVPAAGGCNGAQMSADQRGIPRPQGVGCDVGAAEAGLAPGAIATTLVIGQSSITSVGGETVDLNATVLGGAAASGLVLFFDGAEVIGSANVSAGFANLSTDALSIGTHVLTGFYGGDATHAQSTSARIVHGVTHAPTTTAVVPSANPIAPGASVTFTATVSTTPPSSAVPTGSVLFFDHGALLGTATLAGGIASLATTALVHPGTHDITARYAGDARYNGSTSPVLVETVSGGAATTTAIVSSLNPASFGEVVTFTATVTAASGTPSGSVTFKDGAATLGAAALAGGAASFATSSLAVGAHPITAVYAGDGAFPGSVSAALQQAVSAPGTTLQRTFVASTGADTNPCTLASPCRTLGAAIAATTAGGEVVIVDSGDYGPTTITKPLSIVAPSGIYAGIGVTAGTGIAVNPGSGKVRLRGLTINGLGGATGIDFQSGEALYVESTLVSGFTGPGISTNLGGPAQLFVRESTFRGNGTGASLATGAGVVTPLAATFERCRFEDNATGIRVGGFSARAAVLQSAVVGGTTGIAVQPSIGFGAGSADVRDTTVAKQAAAGLVVGGDGATLATLTVFGSLVTENAIGVDAQAGGTARLTDTTIVGNAIGIRPLTGSIVSLGDNRLTANGTDGTFTTTLPKQ